MRIVLCYPVEERHLKELALVAGPAEIVDAGQERVAEEIHRADIFCGHPKVPIDWDRVVSQGRLAWIQSSAAGLDHLLVPSVVESPILVTSASGVLADQVAEHTLALITAWTRSLPLFFAQQRERVFVRRPTRDLHGQTVGIVGFGGVGRRVAELLAPFRTRVLAVDLFPVDPPVHVAHLTGMDHLDDVLAEVDILILCAPLTAQTRGLMNAARFSRLKRGALLVNVARGPLVVESDLVACLQSGHLAGALLDVTEVEPLPEESPLWSLPNVLITPHVAGQSAWRSDRMTQLFRENLVRYRAGGPLINLVDKHLGFPLRGEVEMFHPCEGGAGFTRGFAFAGDSKPAPDVAGPRGS